MKYSKINQPIRCIMKNSTCYKGTRNFTPKGVLWHSTGANNTSVSRYVQPYETDKNYSEMISLLGKNKYGNDWNHIYVNAGVNAWIGKLANGSVETVQTLEWNQRPWGCGSGSKGSCNDTHIQFEICEDGLYDKTYFEKVYKEACELTAYLCVVYNFDPNGTTYVNGVKVPVILCHADSYKLKLGSNHGDVLHWFKKHGKTMDDVRRDVALLIKSSSSCYEAIGTLVKNGIINSPDYWVAHQNDLEHLDSLLEKLANASVSKKINSFNDVKSAVNYLVECNVIDTSTYWITNYSKVKYLDILLINAANHINSKFPYKVQVTAKELNVRKGAGANYSIVTSIKDKGVYTIVDEKTNGSTKWGLLKSYEKNRDGWISLKYTKKI